MCDVTRNFSYLSYCFINLLCWCPEPKQANELHYNRHVMKRMTATV
jgi:hypothetical protein